MTGEVVSSRYGDVEVSITVANGKVTAVQAVELPTRRPIRPDLGLRRTDPVE